MLGEKESCWEEMPPWDGGKRDNLVYMHSRVGRVVHYLVYTLPTHPGYTSLPSRPPADLSTAGQHVPLPR